MTTQLLPGFRDLYPEDFAVRDYLFSKWRQVARTYGFQEYDGPTLEPLELYTQKSGDEIVGQLFNFVDKGEREVALRPEMTPTFARMVVARHRDYRKPLKWFSIGPFFRYEKAQRGRLREFIQLNADLIGENSVSADAEIVALVIDLLRSFGLTDQDFVVRLSDRRFWSQLLNEIQVPENNQYQVYQAIDKFERAGEEETRKALASAGANAAAIDRILKVLSTGKGEAHLTGELQQVQDLLAAQGLGSFTEIDLRVIRGLAYYTGVVFEVFDRDRKFRAIAAGGRYNNLIKQTSGGSVDLPALGFGMGDVVLTEVLTAKKLLPEMKRTIDFFAVIVDENLRKSALDIIGKLRRERKFSVDYSLTPAKVGKQFEMAEKGGARKSLVFAPDEFSRGEVVIKDMTTRTEERVSIESLLKHE